MGANPSAANHPFFVYGTLLPGQPNAHLWAPYAAATNSGLLPGARLHDMGFYPMLVEVEGTDSVRGVLLTVPAHHRCTVTRLLDRLERYDPRRPEEGLYRRRARRIHLADGATTRAWVYLGRAAVAPERPVIPGGDWAAFARRRQREMDRWWRDHGADYDRSQAPDHRP